MRFRAAATGLVLLAGSLTIASAPSAAATSTAAITGTIRDADTGDPLPGACATVVDRNLLERGPFCADGSGTYTTGLLTLAAYRLRFTNSGYATQWSGGRTGMTMAQSISLTTAGATVDATLTKHFGTIAGTARVPDGTTEALHQVRIATTAGALVTWAYTKADGTYSVPDLPSGSYKIQLYSPNTGLVAQWLPQEATPDTATVYAVSDGQALTVDGQFAQRTSATPSTAAGGFVFLVNGPSIPGAIIHFVTVDIGFEFAGVAADSAGRWQAVVPNGHPYKLRIEGAGVPVQWFPYAQKFGDGFTFTNDLLSQSWPSSLPVVAGWSTVEGVITDPAGTPLPGAAVAFTVISGFRGVTSGVTGADGRYSVSGLPEGDITMRVSHPDFGLQYYPQKTVQADAQVLALHHDQVLHVDEQFAPRGRVEITVMDSNGSMPVTNACVRIDQPGVTTVRVCDSGNGVYSADLAPGSLDIMVTAADHLTAYRSTGNTGAANAMVIRTGQIIKVRVWLTPSATLTLPVKANADGTYPAACAFAVPARFAVDYPDIVSPSELGFCNSTSSGRAGQIVLTGIAAGPTRVFVEAHSNDLGAQWLGVDGGTGDQRKAAVITVPAGGSVTGPQIRLDPAGSIKGVTVAQDTRAPMAMVIRPFAITPGIATICSNIDTVTGCSGSNGAFLVGGLGPYDWPIMFEPVNSPYATVWSGGATNRLDAALIRVRPGQVTRVDVAVPKGTVLAFDRGPDAAPYYSAQAYDVRSGDIVGTTWYGAGSAIVVNPGKYVVAYDDYATSGGRDCWYAPAAPAGTPRISGQVRVDTFPRSIKLVPGESCRQVSLGALSKAG